MLRAFTYNLIFFKCYTYSTRLSDSWWSVVLKGATASQQRQRREEASRLTLGSGSQTSRYSYLTRRDFYCTGHQLLLCLLSLCSVHLILSVSNCCGIRLWVRSLLTQCVSQCCQVTAWGKLSAVAGHHSFFRDVRCWSIRLAALMDSDLAWVNGKSGIVFQKIWHPFYYNNN